MSKITPYHGYLMLWQRVYGLFIVRHRPEISQQELLPIAYEISARMSTLELENILKRQVELCFGSH